MRFKENGLINVIICLLLVSLEIRSITETVATKVDQAKYREMPATLL